jgi:hypothetical protein
VGESIRCLSSHSCISTGWRRYAPVGQLGRNANSETGTISTGRQRLPGSISLVECYTPGRIRTPTPSGDGEHCFWRDAQLSARTVSLRVTTPKLFAWRASLEVTTPKLFARTVSLRVTTPKLFAWRASLEVTTPKLFVRTVSLRVTTPKLFAWRASLEVTTPKLFARTVSLR